MRDRAAARQLENGGGPQLGCDQKRVREVEVSPVLGRSNAPTLGGWGNSSGFRTLHLAVAEDGHTPGLTHF